MTRFIDPSGSSTYGLALCARCSRKFRLGDLRSDPNNPTLMVCEADLDQYDPYRLSPRPEDKVALPFVRPDVPLATNPSGLIAQNGTQFIVSEDGERFIYVID